MARTPAVAFVLLLLCAGRSDADKPDSSPRPAIYLSATAQIITLNSVYSAALYDAKDGTLIRQFPTWDQATALDVSSDQKLLCLGEDGKDLSVWEIATGKRVWKESDTLFQVLEVSFSWDGKRVVARDNCSRVAVYDMSTRKPLVVFKANATGVALSPDGTTGAYAINGLVTFDVAAQTTTATNLPAWHPRYSADGKYVLASTPASTLWVFTMSDIANVKSIDALKSPRRIKPLADGRFLVTNYVAGFVVDPATGEIAEKCKFKSEDFSNIDFDPETLIGVSTSHEFVTSIVNLKTGDILLKIDNSQDFRDYKTRRFYREMVPPVLCTSAVLFLIVIIVVFWIRKATRNSVDQQSS
jgi:hypothetical protein